MRGILTQKGLRLGTPQRSSTDEMTMRRILRFLGTSPDKIRGEGGRYLNGSYNDIAAAFGDGQVDYMYCALAKPAAILTEIGQGRRPARLVGFPDDVRRHLIETYAYNEGVLPAASYPNLQSADLKVTTMDSVILAHEAVPEDVAHGEHGFAPSEFEVPERTTGIPARGGAEASCCTPVRGAKRLRRAVPVSTT